MSNTHSQQLEDIIDVFMQDCFDNEYYLTEMETALRSAISQVADLVRAEEKLVLIKSLEEQLATQNERLARQQARIGG